MARRGRLRAKSASTHPAIKFPRKKLHQQLLPLLHLLLLHIIAINHIGKVYGGSQPPPPPQKPTHGNFAPLPQNSSLQKSNLATTILFSSISCDSSNRPPKTSLQSKIFKGCPKKA